MIGRGSHGTALVNERGPNLGNGGLSMRDVDGEVGSFDIGNVGVRLLNASQYVYSDNKRVGIVVPWRHRVIGITLGGVGQWGTDNDFRAPYPALNISLLISQWIAGQSADGVAVVDTPTQAAEVLKWVGMGQVGVGLRDVEFDWIIGQRYGGFTDFSGANAETYYWLAYPKGNRGRA